MAENPGALLFLQDNDFIDFVAGPDQVNHFKTFVHFSETGVIAVEVAGVLTAMADKELRSAGVSSGMGHGEYATVVVLVIAIQLTINCVTGSARPCAVRASALDHEIWYYPVKSQSIVKSAF